MSRNAQDSGLASLNPGGKEINGNFTKIILMESAWNDQMCTPIFIFTYSLFIGVVVGWGSISPQNSFLLRIEKMKICIENCSSTTPTPASRWSQVQLTKNILFTRKCMKYQDLYKKCSLNLKTFGVGRGGGQFSQNYFFARNCVKCLSLHRKLMFGNLQIGKGREQLTYIFVLDIALLSALDPNPLSFCGDVRNWKTRVSCSSVHFM